MSEEAVKHPTDVRLQTQVSNAQKRVVMIASGEEADVARNFLAGDITVAFNNLYIAFSPGNTTAFVYPTQLLWEYVVEIFQDKTVTKLISRPLGSLRSFLKGVTFTNVQHISDYMSRKGEQRSIPEMKREITDQDSIPDLGDRAASVAFIMMKYKLIADETHKRPKKRKKYFFNKVRDCYLLYLTAFNDILIRYGPLSFVYLANLVRGYPYLCRVKLGPSMALSGLIKVGALSLDRNTTLVSIPDQSPHI